MTINLNPKYEPLRCFIEQIPFTFAHEGNTIYKLRNEIKVIPIEGINLNVKQYRIPSFINRIAYTFFRSPKCIRAYDYALCLLGKGFETPEPIAFILTKKRGLINISYFISEQSTYTRRFYEFGEGGIAGREDIITAFALYTARLHEAEVYHRDFSPGNILFEKKEASVHFSLVDINRMSFGTVSVEKGCRNFARLWGQDDFFRLLAKTYAEARQADVEECTRLILHYRLRFWKRYIQKHGKPFTFEPGF